MLSSLMQLETRMNSMYEHCLVQPWTFFRSRTALFESRER